MFASLVRSDPKCVDPLHSLLETIFATQKYCFDPNLGLGHVVGDSLMQCHMQLLIF